ncbi:hypothetical protein DS909_14505 [Phaeobacter gallaeciensis]|uniref:AI-2E family transporter n=1 Tax=Phaeobacter gallaeciensis TaxID=60890 RepID=A0A366WSY8_9RHOB|nr:MULTISPECIES: AI-2E family transporter [Roseobacteraceae]MBT8171125.1 AI-2E family transporter [Falsiruegeria litorea]RBW53338.1 hypothetical protein DS909_14505 [Phaeobacter gallaeciensis]
MTKTDEQAHSPVPVARTPTWFLTIVTLPVLLGLLWFGRDFLMPVALATLLFILNMALIDRLNSATFAGRNVPRWVAYIGATALIFALLLLLGYSVASQAEAFQTELPKYTERLAQIRVQLQGLIGSENLTAAETFIENFDVESLLTGFASSAASVAGNVGLILMYLAFMLAERGAFTEKLPRLCNTTEQAQRVKDILDAISAGVRQYMWINAATSAMSGTLAFIVLKFLGVDFAIFLAFSVFLLNFIPNIGSFLAVLFPTLVAFLQFDTLTPALIVVVVYGGGDAIIGNIVQPRLQGKSLNLSTFVVMVALTFWGMMWGGVGAFIAVPLTVVIMIICSQIPGLRPFAKLLSSDGILPDDPVTVSDLSGDSRSPEIAPGLREQTAFGSKEPIDEDPELVAIKQELIERKKTREKARNRQKGPPNRGPFKG